MIKSECQRRIISNSLKPPIEVVEKLKLFDSKLELIFNFDSDRWEFYRLQEKGPSYDEDILCWQMSAPSTGSDITVGVIDWLKQFDTTFGGRLSPDDLRDRWVKNVKNILFQNDERIRKEQELASESWKDLISDFGSQKTVVSVPVCVGYNSKRNKQIYAVKKKKAVTNVNC